MYNKILLLFVAIIVLSGCRHKKQQEATDTLVSGVITIVADENLQNILEAELDAFSVRFPEAFIFPQYLDERQAIDYLVKDSVKLAIVGRNLDGYERSLLPKTRVVNCYPFGYEGIAFIINRQNKDSIMSMSQIRDLLLGRISTWRQINPQSSSDTVKIFFASTQNGIMRYVADSITGGTENVSRNLYSLKEGENIFDKVASNPNNIGIIGINQMGNVNSRQYTQNDGKVRILRVSKEAGAKLEDTYLPYAGDVYNGDYPFWRPLYVLISETRDGLPRGFCFFLTQQVGQKVVQKAGLMPITDVHKIATRWTD